MPNFINAYLLSSSPTYTSSQEPTRPSRYLSVMSSHTYLMRIFLRAVVLGLMGWVYVVTNPGSPLAEYLVVGFLFAKILILTASEIIGPKLKDLFRYVKVNVATFRSFFPESVLLADIVKPASDHFTGACAILSIHFLVVILLYSYQKLRAIRWLRHLLQIGGFWTLRVYWTIVLLRLTGIKLQLHL